MLAALLDATDPQILLQVRYPQIAQKLLTDNKAYAGRAARVGIHNDCFLADDTDAGTYRSSPTATDKDWLARESATRPVGGETCRVNPPRSALTTARDELARFHWTYLNSQFNIGVLSSWGGAAEAAIGDSLGYRLSLAESRISPTARLGGALTVELSLDNTGFAAPVRDGRSSSS